jgi:hypothetical protein
MYRAVDLSSRSPSLHSRCTAGGSGHQESEHTALKLLCCSKTALTGEPGSIVSVGASPGHKLLPPWAGSKRLTHWTSETVYWSEAAGPPQGSPPPPPINLTVALTGHCVARRRRTRSRQGMCDHVGFSLCRHEV